jgi:hypothetical protein
MDSEHRLLVWVAGIILMIVISIAGSCSYTNYTDDKAIADMVAKGANPIDAGCAINMNSNSNSTTHLALCAGQRRPQQ